MTTKRFAALLMLCLLLLGLVFTALHYNTAPAPGQIRLACVGDSITYGLGALKLPEGSYPSRLAPLLGRDYHVANFGAVAFAVQSDSNYPYRSHEYFRRSLDYGADIVIFMLGSNDAKAVNWHGAEYFEAEYLSLLSEYEALETSPEIILCTPCASFIPPEEVNEQSIDNALICEIAGAVRKVAADKGLRLIDINALTADKPQWYIFDRIHLNDEGYAALAREVYKVISSL